MEWDTQNTESVQTVLDSFRGVWERVEGTQATNLPSDGEPKASARSDNDSHHHEDCLRKLIETATESAMYDRALACRCRGASRTMLLEHASQASHRAACLRGEYFVRYGMRHCPPESCPRLGDTLSALREGMLRDEAAAKAYSRAAEHMEDKDLRSALERFACEADSASAEKRRMILRCFQ